MILKPRKTNNSDCSGKASANANALAIPSSQLSDVTLTPLTNRGSNSQNSQLTAKIDTIRFSVPYRTPARFSALISAVFGAFGDTPVLESGKGVRNGQGYHNSGYGIKGILLAWNEPGKESKGAPNGSMLFSIPGRALSGVTQRRLWELFHTLEKYEVKYTRVDVAIDDYSKSISYRQMRAAIDERQVVGVDTAWDETRHSMSGKYKGFTLCFGARDSNAHFRYYDKDAESNGLVKAYRLEGEFKNELAQALIKEYLSIPVGQYDELASQLLAGVVVKKIDFLERPKKAGEKNKSRRKRLDWWQAFKDRIGAEIKLGITYKDPTLQATANWVKRSVAPTLAVLRQVLGTLDFRAWLDNVIDEKASNLTAQSEAKIEVWKRLRGQVFGSIPPLVNPFIPKKISTQDVKGIAPYEYPEPVYPIGSIVRHLVDGIARKVVACTHTHAQLEGLEKAVSVYLLKPC